MQQPDKDQSAGPSWQNFGHPERTTAEVRGLPIERWPEGLKLRLAPCLVRAQELISEYSRRGSSPYTPDWCIYVAFDDKGTSEVEESIRFQYEDLGDPVVPEQYVYRDQTGQYRVMIVDKNAIDPEETDDAYLGQARRVFEALQITDAMVDDWEELAHMATYSIYEATVKRDE